MLIVNVPVTFLGTEGFSALRDGRYIDFKCYSLELMYLDCERGLSRCKRWHEHNSSLFGRSNAAAPQLADFLLRRSFKALVLFATAAAYTPSVSAALEQRDSCLSLPPSPPYPPVLGRSNHKIRK